MKRIGNQEEAVIALSIVNEQWFGLGKKPVPSGWRHLGLGTTRTAWLSPTMVVYKVPRPEHPNHEEGIRHNPLEAERFAMWAGRSFCTEYCCLYEVMDEEGRLLPILAMEHVESDGSDPRNLDEMWDALRAVDAEDRHTGNWRVRDGRAIVIDAAGAAAAHVPSYIPPELYGHGRLFDRNRPAAPSSAALWEMAPSKAVTGTTFWIVIGCAALVVALGALLVPQER